MKIVAGFSKYHFDWNRISKVELFVDHCQNTRDLCLPVYRCWRDGAGCQVNCIRIFKKYFDRNAAIFYEKYLDEQSQFD